MEFALIVFIIVTCCLAAGFLIGLAIILSLNRSKDQPDSQTDDKEKQVITQVRNTGDAYFCFLINSTPGKPNFLTVSTSDPGSSLITTYSSADGIDPEDLIRPHRAAEIKLDQENDTSIILSSANPAKLVKTFNDRIKLFFTQQNDKEEFKSKCDVVAHIVVSKAQDNVCITKIRASNKIQIDRFYKNTMSWMNAYKSQIAPPFSIRLDNEELYRIFIYYSSDENSLCLNSEKGLKMRSEDKVAGDIKN